MDCAICKNLVPETLPYLKPGQAATILIDEYELSLSVRSTPCTECKLLFDAISLKRNEWPSSKEQSTTILSMSKTGSRFRLFGTKGECSCASFDQTSTPQLKMPERYLQSLEMHNLFRNIRILPRVCHFCSHGIKPAGTRTFCVSQRTQSVLPTRVIETGTSLVTTADVSLLETEGLRG